MGISITNFHLRHASLESVEKAARTVVQDAAYLSKPLGGWISLYDANTTHPGELHRVAETLSAGLGCPVWGFLIHDSDVLMYVVYDLGSLRDEYSSKPDHLGPVADSRRQRLAGQPEVVKQYAQANSSLEDIKRFFSGTATLGAQNDQFKEKVRQTIRSTSTESVGQMLGFAAQHLGAMPPELLRETLTKAGVPMNHPMLAPFMQNPAMFLQQLASSPEALKMMMDQVGAMSEASLDAGMGNPSAVQIPAEVRLLELTRLLGLEPQRACLSYELVRRGEGIDRSQYSLLNP